MEHRWGLPVPDGAGRAGTCPAPTVLLAGTAFRDDLVGAGLVLARPAPSGAGNTAIILVLLVLSRRLRTSHVRRFHRYAPVAANERLVIAYKGEEGKTALDILKARAKVRTSTSSLGELVEEINGMKSSEHEHLLFFVNGEMSEVGAGGYVTKQSDRIEWKLVGPKNSNPGGKK